MTPGFGGVQVHLRIWPYGLDSHEQQPLHARHQGGDDGDDEDDDEDDCDDEDYDAQLIFVIILTTDRLFSTRRIIF